MDEREPAFVILSEAKDLASVTDSDMEKRTFVGSQHVVTDERGVTCAADAIIIMRKQTNLKYTIKYIKMPAARIRILIIWLFLTGSASVLHAQQSPAMQKNAEGVSQCQENNFQNAYATFTDVLSLATTDLERCTAWRNMAYCDVHLENYYEAESLLTVVIDTIRSLPSSAITRDYYVELAGAYKDRAALRKNNLYDYKGAREDNKQMQLANHLSGHDERNATNDVNTLACPRGGVILPYDASGAGVELGLMLFNNNKEELVRGISLSGEFLVLKGKFIPGARITYETCSHFLGGQIGLASYRNPGNGRMDNRLMFDGGFTLNGIINLYIGSSISFNKTENQVSAIDGVRISLVINFTLGK